MSHGSRYIQGIRDTLRSNRSHSAAKYENDTAKASYITRYMVTRCQCSMALLMPFAVPSFSFISKISQYTFDMQFSVQQTLFTPYRFFLMFLAGIPAAFSCFFRRLKSFFDIFLFTLTLIFLI